MATLSGSFNTTAFTSDSGTRYLTFSWTGTQDVSNNTTTISWSLKGGGTHYGYVIGRNISLTVNGENKYNNTTSSGLEIGNGTRGKYVDTITTGTTIINHNVDGSASFSASASCRLSSTNVSGSGTWELTSIPRASSATVTQSGSSYGASVTFNISSASTSFTHVIQMFINGSNSPAKSLDIGANTTSETYSIPTTTIRDNMNTGDNTLKFKILTYSNGTHIGTSDVSGSCTINRPYEATVSASPSSVTYGSNITITKDNKGASGLTYQLQIQKNNGSWSNLSQYSYSVPNSEVGVYSTYRFRVITSYGGVELGTSYTDNISISKPEASTITVNKTAMNYGDSLTLKIASNLSSYTHSIQISYNGGTYSDYKTGVTSAAGNSGVSYTLSTDNASRLTSTSNTIQFKVITYYETLVVGEKISAAITVNTPTNGTFDPTVSLAYEGADSASKTHLTTYQKFIAGKSTIKVTATASTKYGAGISSLTLTNAGSTTSSTLSGTYTASTDASYSATVTDSRNKSSSASVTPPVYSYNAVSAAVTACRRCTSTTNTAVNDQGGYMYVAVSWSIVSLGDANTKAFTAQYRQVGTTSWTSFDKSALNEYSGTTSWVVAADTTKSFEVQFTVSDAFTSATSTAKINTISVLIDLGAGKNSIAIGKVSSNADKHLEFGDDWKIDGDITYTGTLNFSQGSSSVDGSIHEILRGIMGNNEAWRIAHGATASDSGFMELATADNGNEPIYVRQYRGGDGNAFGVLSRTATLLDANGDTQFPGKLSTNGTIWSSMSGSESQVGASSGAGGIYIYSQASNTGYRGLYTRNAAGTAKPIIDINQNNSVSFLGTASSCSGNAATATTATSANIPTGFTSHVTSWTWGTLTTANGYTLLTGWDGPSNASIAFAAKSGQVSVQIDGRYYQNEGSSRVPIVEKGTSLPSTSGYLDGDIFIVY